MYSNMYNLCNSNAARPRVITTNTHFINPASNIYATSVFRTQRPNYNPGMWGPGAWDFLFTVAKSYPNNPSYSEKLKMRRFLESMDYCLPCKKCRNNFACEIGFLTEGDLTNSQTVINWLNKLRERIKQRKNEEK